METGQLPLRDIHLPPPIGWWPPAIGWWLLAVLISLLLALMYWFYKRITKTTALKAAKKQLLLIKNNEQLENAQKLAQLSALIRRAAISISGRNECAGLTGKKWLEFLDRSLKDAPFTEGVGRLFENAVYRQVNPEEQEIKQLFSLCETWLNAQKRKQK